MKNKNIENPLLNLITSGKIPLVFWQKKLKRNYHVFHSNVNLRDEPIVTIFDSKYKCNDDLNCNGNRMQP